MITIDRSRFKSYLEIPERDSTTIVYKNLLPLEAIVKLENAENTKIVAILCLLSGKIYSRKANTKRCTIAYITTRNSRIRIAKKDVVLEKGTIVFFGSNLNRKEILVDGNGLLFYEYAGLPTIFSTVVKRLEYAKYIRDNLKDIREQQPWQQCPRKHIDICKDIGKGCFGNVFEGKTICTHFAVKIAKIKTDTSKELFCRKSASWHEVIILKDIIKPVITNKVCPNLPLLIDTFTCGDCEINIDGKKTHSPCISLILELANGTLKNYLKVKRTEEELYSCLFQVMAGIYGIQLYGQIMNYDVKKENVLYYEVESGGYWVYTIHGKDYYVPNCGAMFVINDFGLSRPMSPKYELHKTEKDVNFRLGGRYFRIKNGKLLPIGNEDKKGNITIGKKKYKCEDYFLCKGSISPSNKLTTEQLLNSDEFPPVEFYNDTQDGLRMFCGGKRTTQKGNHKAYEFNKEFVKNVKKYLGKGECAKDGKFTTKASELCAGWFIVDFFSQFLEKKTNILERYVMS